MLHIVDVALLLDLNEFGELYEDDDDKFSDDHITSWEEKDTGRYYIQNFLYNGTGLIHRSVYFYVCILNKLLELRSKMKSPFCKLQTAEIHRIDKKILCVLQCCPQDLEWGKAHLSLLYILRSWVYHRHKNLNVYGAYN